jgi:hypothetical protein
MQKYFCGGTLVVRTVPNAPGLFDVCCEHGIAHPGRGSAKPLVLIQEFVAQNQALGPSQLFQLLVHHLTAKGEDPGQITKKQVGYYWMKSVVGCFKRDPNPIASASLLVAELCSVSLLYAVEGTNEVPCQIAVSVNLGLEIIARHQVSELLIDSTRT